MKPFLLNKVCLALYHNCKNKVINLTFFETPCNMRFQNSLTREEFDRRLPDIYYILHISSDKKVLSIMQRDKEFNKDILLSQEEDFSFSSLEENGVLDYTVQYYNEFAPFSKNSDVLIKTGAFKSTEECLKFDVSLFISLFRLMGETISLVIKNDTDFYLAHYIDGRLFISEISDLAMTIHQCNFYTVNKILPHYEVVDFVAYPQNLSIKFFLEKLQKICDVKELRYNMCSL